MDLSSKTLVVATLVGKMADLDLRIGSVTIGPGRAPEDCSLILMGDGGVIGRASTLLDDLGEPHLVGRIDSPLTRVVGTFDGVRVSLLSTES